MIRLLRAVSVAMVVVCALPAQAYLLSQITRTGNFTSSSTSLIQVPLDNEGDIGLTFQGISFTAPIQIIYNAECGVLGPPQARVAIEILVDGHQIDPASGTHFAFCTATSVTRYSWIGATRQSVVVVTGDGFHDVEVHAVGVGGATKWWLGDSSLTIAY